MRNTEKTKTWERTSTPGLLRHRSGLYYARLSVAGKTKFIPLETKLRAIADIKFSEHKTRVLKGRKAAKKAGGGAGTMGDIIVILRQQIEEDADIGASTRGRYLQDVKYCEKTWPTLASMRPDQVTEDAIKSWKNRAMTFGSGFVPPGSKNTKAEGSSGRTFNGGLGIVRRLLDVAIKHGAVHENVIVAAGKRKGSKLRADDKPEPAYAPETEVMEKIFAEIEAGSGIGGWGVELADFCRGIAYTGSRQAEAAGITWADVSTATGFLKIEGTKTASAKRSVPMTQAFRVLAERILERRKKSLGASPLRTDRVFRVAEAQKALDRACLVLSAKRVTHHNLRDYFCTRAILSGVSIRVLARWMGHADNGALLLKRYSHINDADSAAQAVKVNFGGAS